MRAGGHSIMSEAMAPAIIQSILQSGMLEAGEALTLRRWFYGDGMVHREDAESLFRVNRALKGKFRDFNALFVELLTDYVVYQLLPTGRVTEEQADWLVAQMGGPGATVETAAELDLLVEVMEEAHEIPSTLAVFALAQVRHAAITGEGPAAQGRPHFSRTVDAGDVDLLGRILDGARGATGSAVSRAEADMLFDIADACSGSANDRAWDRLFVRAIATHLLGTSEPRRAGSGLAVRLDGSDDPMGEAVTGRSRKVDHAGAAWLASRIHRDGQVTEAERRLLSFFDGEAVGDPARAAIVRLA
jgi:hypothetical protein